MKLEVGMYVRTDRGKIGKLRREVKDYYELEYPRNVCDLVYKNRIIKWSYKLLDILMRGDYVNGKQIDNIQLGRGEYVLVGLHRIYESEIKSIVTKEHFEQMAYKVGE